MKKLKVGMTVRHENGQIGEIIDFDDKHPIFNVKVRFQGQTEPLWVSRQCLKVHKNSLEYKRGDLVVYKGKVAFVLGGDFGDDVHIAALEGNCRTMWVKDTEIHYIGSLKKAIKRVVKQRYQGDMK